MFFAKYILKDRVTKIEGLIRNIKPEQEDIEIEKSRLYSHLYDISLGLEECCFAFTSPRLYRLTLNSITRIIRDLKSTVSGQDLLDIIQDVTDLFFDFDYSSYNPKDLTYSYKTLENLKSIDLLSIDPIKKELDKQNRDFTLFEPNCSQGDTFAYIESDNILTYGIELGNDYPTAKARATKMAKGLLRGSRIKNDAFDVLIAKCAIDFTLANNLSIASSLSKTEKRFILDMNKYIRPNGVVLFAIPHFRLYKDICEHIAKYYDNVKIFKDDGIYWDQKRLIYIYGQKSLTRNFDEDTYNELRKCYNPSSTLPLKEDTVLDYRLPQSHIEIDIFKGSVLDMDELHDIINTSGATEEFFKQQSVEKIGDSTTRPLLPFNIGQVGLVLTSGCLDGIIDEGDGHYHLVKGKVSKKSETKSNVNDGVIEENETISNRVEINVLLPNGEYKVLT